MLWLIWQMGFLLLAAVGLGVLLGYLIWSGSAQQAEIAELHADNERLRQVNENLARRMGEGAGKTADTKPDSDSSATADAAAAVSPADPVSGSGAAAFDDEDREDAPEEPAIVTPANPVTPDASDADAVDGMPADGDDDLTRIKGLGPKAEAALKAGGVTTLSQIAAWSEDEIDEWDGRVNGRGRIRRDDWVGQARSLSAG